MFCRHRHRHRRSRRHDGCHVSRGASKAYVLDLDNIYIYTCACLLVVCGMGVGKPLSSFEEFRWQQAAEKSQRDAAGLSQLFHGGLYETESLQLMFKYWWTACSKILPQPAGWRNGRSSCLPFNNKSTDL